MVSAVNSHSASHAHHSTGAPSGGAPNPPAKLGIKDSIDGKPPALAKSLKTQVGPMPDCSMPCASKKDDAKSAPKEDSKGGPAGAPKDAPKGDSKGGPAGAPKDAPKGDSKGGPTGAPKDAPKGDSKGGPDGAPKDAPKGDSKGGPASAPKDAPKGGAADAPKGADPKQGDVMGALKQALNGLYEGAKKLANETKNPELKAYAEAQANQLKQIIDALGGADPKGADPKGSPAGAPKDTPAGAPKDAPKDGPAGAPKDAPKDGPAGAPKDAPKDGPAGAPKASTKEPANDAPQAGGPQAGDAKQGDIIGTLMLALGSMYEQAQKLANETKDPELKAFAEAQANQLKQIIDVVGKMAGTPGGTTPGNPSPGSPSPGSPTPGGATPGAPAPGGPAPGAPAPGGAAPGGPAPGTPAPGAKTSVTPPGEDCTTC